MRICPAGVAYLLLVMAEKDSSHVPSIAMFLIYLGGLLGGGLSVYDLVVDDYQAMDMSCAA